MAKKAKKIVRKVVKKKHKIAKKPVKRAVKIVKKSEGKLIGKITHYFSEIKVAVLDLSSTLKEGDEIRIVGGEDTDFNQTIVSMQIEHEKVKTAKKGDGVGLKVKEKVREGYKVYKI